MEGKINELEMKYDHLSDLVALVDEYSRHMMSQMLGQLTLLIAIASVVIMGATYFMIKSIVNDKVDKEIEKKVIHILSQNQPVYYARGKSLPDKEKCINLSNDIKGIEDLEPGTLMIIEAKPKEMTYDQLENGVSLKLIINEHGTRVIKIDNFHEENGEFTWSLAWIRKRYS